MAETVDDRYQVTLMLEEIARRDDRPALERRLRRWTTTLCRRHIDRIKLLAEVLMREGSLSDGYTRFDWHPEARARPLASTALAP